MDNLRAVIKEVLQRAPGSTRELARQAGLSHTALQRVRDGQMSLSPERLDALADALGRWSVDCSELAELVREVARSLELDQEESDG